MSQNNEAGQITNLINELTSNQTNDIEHKNILINKCLISLQNIKLMLKKNINFNRNGEYWRKYVESCSE